MVNRLVVNLAWESGRDSLRWGLLVSTLFGLTDRIGAQSGADRQAVSSRISVEVIWRVDFVETVGHHAEAAAAWNDGTIWVSTNNGQAIWELDADGESIQLVREDIEIAHEVAGSPALAMLPGHGMLLLARFGVIRFRTAADPGSIVDRITRATVRGFGGFPNGDYVVAYGPWRDDPHKEYAVHRYDMEGRHLASWHPAFSYPEWGDQEWRAVLRMSGGPVAITGKGDLLVSDLVPFRVTRYTGGLGDRGTVVVESENVLSRVEIRRALPRPGTYTFDWSRAVFVDEMSHRGILNVLLISERSMFRNVRYPRWVVVTPDGEVVADERMDYFLIGTIGKGTDTYLATTAGGDLVKVAVSVEEAFPQP